MNPQGSVAHPTLSLGEIKQSWGVACSIRFVASLDFAGCFRMRAASFFSLLGMCAISAFILGSGGGRGRIGGISRGLVG